MTISYAFPNPTSSQESEVFNFLNNFYLISDTPDAHGLYADQFASDAVFILGSRRNHGSVEIRNFREAMWTQAAERHHEIKEVFTAGPDSSVIMLHGTVAYTAKDGKKSVKDWAGRAVLVKNHVAEKWKFQFYQVYLDTAN